MQTAALIARVRWLSGLFTAAAEDLRHRARPLHPDVANYQLVGPPWDAVAAYTVPWFEVVAGLCLMLAILPRRDPHDRRTGRGFRHLHRLGLGAPTRHLKHGLILPVSATKTPAPHAGPTRTLKVAIPKGSLQEPTIELSPRLATRFTSPRAACALPRTTRNSTSS
jgi:hypothetical protein